MSSNLNLSDHAYQRDLDFDLPVKSKRGSLGFAVDFFFWKAFTDHIISANDQQTISWLRESILKWTYTKNRIFSENILGTKSAKFTKICIETDNVNFTWKSDAIKGMLATLYIVFPPMNMDRMNNKSVSDSILRPKLYCSTLSQLKRRS